MAQAFLDAYAKRDATAAGALTTDAAAATASLKRSLDGLGATARATFTITSVTPHEQDRVDRRLLGVVDAARVHGEVEIHRHPAGGADQGDQGPQRLAGHLVGDATSNPI